MPSTNTKVHVITPFSHSPVKDSIFCLSNDLNTFGVVPGDGFKGYIDPDILRCANGNFGQMYDNGNLICCSYNLLIGWDSTNTDTLS